MGKTAKGGDKGGKRVSETIGDQMEKSVGI